MSVDTMLSTQREVLSESVQSWFHDSSSLAAMLRKRTPGYPIGRYAARFPVQLYPGAAVAKGNFNGGSLTHYAQGQTDKLRAGYFNFYCGWGLTFEQQRIANQSVGEFKNITAKIASDAMTVFETAQNINVFNDGSGRLTSASSAHSSSTYTFNAAGDLYGTNRLILGGKYDVWSSDLATKRGTGVQLTAVDNNARTAKYSGTVTSPTAGDILTIVGLDVYGPSTPTTGASAYPGTNPISGAGYGDDSWIHGIDHFLNDSLSSYYYGLQRSVHPVGLQPITYDASSSALTFQTMTEMRAKTVIRTSNEVWRKWTGWANPGHAVNLQSQIQQVQLVTVTGQKAGWTDLAPDVDLGYGTPIMVDGVPIMLCRYVRRDQVQLLDAVNDIQYIGVDPEFFDHFGNAGPIIGLRDANGYPATIGLTFMVASAEYIHLQPGNCGLIKGLSYPSWA